MEKFKSNGIVGFSRIRQFTVTQSLAFNVEEKRDHSNIEPNDIWVALGYSDQLGLSHH